MSPPIKKKKAPRNPYAMPAKRRRGGPMKDRRTPRGGNKNKQEEYKELGKE